MEREENISEIYIIAECVPYEGSSVIQVITSKELADSIVARLNELMKSSTSDCYYTVELQQIDDSEPQFMTHSKSLFCFENSRDSGNFVNYLNFDDFNEIPETGKRNAYLDSPFYAYEEFYVWANSEEEAEKIINEDINKNPLVFKVKEDEK